MHQPVQPARGTCVAVSATSFEQVEAICLKLFGFKLFTVLRRLPESGEIERIYSSNARDYPVGGRKPMGPTPWGAVVLDGGQAWLGNGADDVRWAFPDSTLLLQLGCDAIACAPIVKDGTTIAVLSLSDGIDSYEPADLVPLSLLAGLLVDAVLAND